jgi:hypothetical protein
MNEQKETQSDIRAEILERINKIEKCSQEQIIETTNTFCDWWFNYKNLLNRIIEPIAHCK